MDRSYWARRSGKRRAIDQREVQKKAGPYANAFMGRMALRAELSPASCPHVLGTDDWKTWYGGWIFGLDQMLEFANDYGPGRGTYI